VRPHANVIAVFASLLIAGCGSGASSSSSSSPATTTGAATYETDH
jgi:hypothetical protein